jgi:hypothetical protein
MASDDDEPMRFRDFLNINSRSVLLVALCGR